MLPRCSVVEMPTQNSLTLLPQRGEWMSVLRGFMVEGLNNGGIVCSKPLVVGMATFPHSGYIDSGINIVPSSNPGFSTC